MTTRSAEATRLEQVRSLARESAEAAASALGQLCGLDVQAEEVCVCADSVATGAAKFETGILFEADGALCGVVAILLSGAGRAALLEALGAEALADSALREVGNIVASHSVSAAAERLGERVNLSVPTLVREDAGSVVDRLLARRQDVVVTATELRRPGAEHEIVLVFAAEAS